MRIINQKEFKKVRDVKLNKDGKVIGQIVRFNGQVFYFTVRRPEHFMRKHQGFGIDKLILRRILEEENALKEMLQDKDFKLLILFFYKGVKEKRYYVADPYDFLYSDIEEGYTKDTGDAVESYGVQKFLPLKSLTLVGYDREDYEFGGKI